MQRQLLTTALFLTSIALVLTPVLLLAYGANTATFSATATVGNGAPTVEADSGYAITGSAGTFQFVYLYFNATDPNGGSDLNESTATVRINLTGETTRTTSNCTSSVVNASTHRFNCSLALYYYDGAGVWTLNASIRDNSSTYDDDPLRSVSVNNLDYVATTLASVAFSSAPGSTDVAAAPNTQSLNNTGNQNYLSINVTGYSFVSGGNILGVSNVTFNATVAGAGAYGQLLVNGTEVNMTNSSLAKGDDSRKPLFFWLDIPASQPAGVYSAQSSWVLEANTNA